MHGTVGSSNTKGEGHRKLAPQIRRLLSQKKEAKKPSRNLLLMVYEAKPNPGNFHSGKETEIGIQDLSFQGGDLLINAIFSALWYKKR